MAGDIEVAISQVTASPGLLSAFRGQFPSFKGMAQALGISERSAQRYYTTGAQKRSPSLSTRAKMALQLPLVAHVQGQFYFDTPGGSSDTRQRNISFTMTRQEAAAIRSASSPEQARELFFEAYGMAAPDAVIGADYSFSV